MLGDLTMPPVPEAVLREALEFTLAGDNLAAAFLLIRRTTLEGRQAIDLLMEIEARIRRHLEPIGRQIAAGRTLTNDAHQNAVAKNSTAAQKE
jgi:hypothetical protein